MIMNNKELGKIGEDEVCKYLEDLNYKIINKNFRCRQGEIDIIAVNKNEVVFVEVKTRISTLYGEPAKAINKIKQKHIENASRYYIYINKLENRFIRFDVIEAYLKSGIFYINHIKNVFW